MVAGQVSTGELNVPEPDRGPLKARALRNPCREFELLSGSVHKSVSILNTIRPPKRSTNALQPRYDAIGDGGFGRLSSCSLCRPKLFVISRAPLGHFIINHPRHAEPNYHLLTDSLAEGVSQELGIFEIHFGVEEKTTKTRVPVPHALPVLSIHV
jgi:hypothetical protein